MIKQVVRFTLKDTELPFPAEVNVQFLGQFLADPKDKIALIEYDEQTMPALPEGVVLIENELPRGFLSCLGYGGYLSKAAIISWRYPIDDQIKLLRELASGEPGAAEAFAEFNQFCKLIP